MAVDPVLLLIAGAGCGSDPSSLSTASPDYEFTLACGETGSGDGQFALHDGPVAAGVAVDADGNVHVADTSNNRIAKFAPVD
ncbi:hypothetical protein FJ251_12210 [bacterium]|nr:hypothetical protein [bacterium]